MSALLRFACLKPSFDEQGVFISSTIFLHISVYEMTANDQLKDKALPFGTLNVAHQMIHVLIAKIYGEVPPGSNKQTPDKDKFKVIVK